MRQPSAHYPSWGFETPEPTRQICRSRQRKLITPHGDLKRVRGGGIRVGVFYATHYPSWGFETLLRGVRGGRQCPLITPHGDLKPCNWPTVVEVSSELITPHGDLKLYPLHCEWSRYARLITPHGDLKPGDGGQAANRNQTHYPSWGFETRPLGNRSQRESSLITPHGDLKRAQPLEVFEHLKRGSLPLMGI